ncbi:M24 family metallopeptidase [Paraliobacillus sp. JSM ZJ581]|uniref:M24 family metallopeptidase n=1 Tax=Paraliobacillus sp. JSM ZJ581 TaxID=3342118 RepID=UPI0035A82348
MIDVKKITAPLADNYGNKVMLTDETIEKRLEKVLYQMKEKGLSSVVVYADKEHGSSFEYLVGFIPRFEEALLLLNQDGTSTSILGNENYNKAQYSRIKTIGKHCSLFSLPNQPMNNLSELAEILGETDIDTSKQVGIVGWKLIPGMSNQFDIPEFIVNALSSKIGKDKLVNATDIFIGPENGARITNNANEIAHYEYGASLASDAVLEAMDTLEVGKKESDVGELLTKHGQYNNVVTICAFGKRFINGNVYPTQNTLSNGDQVALTVAYKGGLSSRSGYAVDNMEELDKKDKNYFNEVVIPYFSAYHYWLTNIKIGIRGGEFYEKFEAFYPQNIYGWELCPGHLTADEEWMSSPFYKGSDAVVRSGMIFQVDFIPSQKNHHGVSAESTVAIADEQLRNDIQQAYPKLWERIEKRRNYISEEINIQLPKEVLPLASTLGYYRPFMLNKDYALVVKG